MIRNKDIVLEPSENRASDHTPKASVNGPNTYFPPNPLRTEFKVGSWVLAKDPADNVFRSGDITGIMRMDGKVTYTVKLEPYHGGRIVTTEIVQ